MSNLECPQNYNNCTFEQMKSCPGDPKVCMAQQWIIDNYPNAGLSKITAKTGWPTIYALIRALQSELGISVTEQSNSFGATTSSLFTTKYGDGVKVGAKGNTVGIIQSAMWIKGYDTGSWNEITTNFSIEMANKINELRKDAGLKSSLTGLVDLNVIKGLLSMDQFKLLEWSPQATEAIRKAQQWLNTEYLNYTGLMPCDGLYGRNTNKALIKAVQAEEGMSTSEATGNFGKQTKAQLPIITIDTGSQTNYPAYIKLFKFALHANGHKVEINSSFDSTLKSSIQSFQQFMMLPITGKIDTATWCAVLISCGDSERAGAAFDTSFILNKGQIEQLKNSGFRFAGRYLSGTVTRNDKSVSKALTHEEISNMHSNGMKIYPIFQQGGRDLIYYTQAYGKRHAEVAYTRATYYGIPSGTTIYFAVDMDALDHEITSSIIPYFEAVKMTLAAKSPQYTVGVYGTRNLCTQVIDAKLADTAFVSDMSYAWSGNLGYPMPTRWAFDQFYEYNEKSIHGNFDIDKNTASNMFANGFSSVGNKQAIDINTPYRLTSISDGNATESISLVCRNAVQGAEVLTESGTILPNDKTARWFIKESPYSKGDYYISPEIGHNTALPLCLTIGEKRDGQPVYSPGYKIYLDYHTTENAERQTVRFYDLLMQANNITNGRAIGLTMNVLEGLFKFAKRYYMVAEFNKKGVKFLEEYEIASTNAPSAHWSLSRIPDYVPDTPVLEIGKHYTLRSGDLYVGVEDGPSTIWSGSNVILMKNDGTNRVMWECYQTSRGDIALKTDVVATNSQDRYNRIMAIAPNESNRFIVTHMPDYTGGAGGPVIPMLYPGNTGGVYRIMRDMGGIDYFVAAASNSSGSNLGYYDRDSLEGKVLDWSVEEFESGTIPEPNPGDGSVESGVLCNIQNIKSGKYLNFYSSGTIKNGTRVCTYNKDSSDEQLFWYQDGKFFSYTDNEFCLDRHYVTNAAQAWKSVASEDVNQTMDVINKSDYSLIKLADSNLYLTQANSTTSFPDVTWSSSSSNELAQWKIIPVNSQSKGIALNNNSIQVGTILANTSAKPYKNRFEPNQCTWYCQGRALEKCGKLPTFNLDSGLDGDTWFSAMHGEKSESVPRANSIASYEGNGTGHVAFIEHVSGDTVYFTESNVGSLDYTVKSLSKSDMNNWLDLTLRGYIYL